MCSQIFDVTGEQNSIYTLRMVIVVSMKVVHHANAGKKTKTLHHMGLLLFLPSK